jgi:hypothetical protein
MEVKRNVMKTLLLFALTLALSFGAFAQTTGQLCWTPDKTTPARTICRDLTPALKQSLNAFIATQMVEIGKDAGGKPIMGPKYNGIGDLLFTALADGVFAPIIDQFPPANVITAKAAADADAATLATRKAAHVGKATVIEP